MKTAAAEERRVRCRRSRLRPGAITTLALSVAVALVGCGPFGDERRPGLWVVGAHGGGGFWLVQAEGVGPCGPGWAPDGRSVAYAGAQEGVSDSALENDVLVQRLDGGDPINLTAVIGGNCIGHDWSPDGLRVVVLCSVPEGNTGVWHTEVWSV